MPQQHPGEAFESELIKSASAGDELKNEPTYAAQEWVGALLQDLFDPDDADNRKQAQELLRRLHYAFQSIRTKDIHAEKNNPGEPAKKSKRVTRFKDALISDRFAPVRPLARSLWPLLPFLSYVWDRLVTRTVDPDVVIARWHEYFFVMLCTKPRRMRTPLYTLGVDVVGSLQVRNVDPHEVAMKAMESLERRALPVTRYVAKARTVKEAAALVRNYMAGAIRRRAMGLVHSHLHVPLLPPSTERRARNVHGVDTRNADAVEAYRQRMKSNQGQRPAGDTTIPRLAKALGRSRDTVTKALRRAERRYGFEAKREADVTVMTIEEARHVIACLPPERHRRRH